MQLVGSTRRTGQFIVPFFLGGGHGLSATLVGPDISNAPWTAVVVTVADDGGSSVACQETRSCPRATCAWPWPPAATTGLTWRDVMQLYLDTTVP